MNPRLTVATAFATLAASIALFPLMGDASWLWWGAGAVAVGAVVGALTRIRALPAPVCLAAALAAQALYLNAAFAGSRSWARIAPTPGSLRHLATLASVAMREMAVYAPPVPPSRAVTLVTAAGIGVVGVFADLIAVRLRRPALAGLPLLVLFCVPLTTTASAGWVATAATFSLAMAGYLGLLSVDGRERLRLWGHVVPVRGMTEGNKPDTRPLRATGRRIGFAAVVLALFAPLLAPGLQRHPMFGGPGVSGTGAGAALALPAPLVQLSQQLHVTHPRTVLTYHTADQAPPYLQVYVLNKLGTDAWTLTAPRATVPIGAGPLPPVPGLSAGTAASTVRETIRLSAALGGGPTTLTYLPVPYAPRELQVPGHWRADRGSLSVVTGGATLTGLRYAVTSEDVNPSPRQLRAAPAPPAAEAGALSVPAAFGRLTRLADRITAGHTTAYAKAVALQNWFTQTGNFTYSLNAPAPDTPAALITFLTRTRRGYCQQFAFAMAVLARLLSIPSRVVVGYTQGVPIGNGNWRVTTSDAHAWPELYFAGAGWLRFEPTPAGSPGHAGQATATTPPYTYAASPTGQPGSKPVSTGRQPTTTPTVGTPGRIGASAKLNHLLGGGKGANAPLPTPSTPFPAFPLALAVAAVALLAPAFTRMVVRRVRWQRAETAADRSHAAWRELRCDLADLRIGVRPSETPRALARRLAADFRLDAGVRDCLERVARGAERALYSAEPTPADGLRDDVRAVRRALARACGPRRRWAAALAPASVLIPAKNGLASAVDVLGWLDALGGRLRERLPRRPRPSAAPWHG